MEVRLFYTWSAFLNIPLLALFALTRGNELVRGDIERWSSVQGLVGRAYWRFLLRCRSRVFRSVFYHRIKCGPLCTEMLMRLLSILYKSEPTLVIYTRDIGPGLFVQHGLCTIIAARSIGRNCWINQQVTVGYTNNTDCPSIGDDVQIGCGAKVLGSIVVGDRSWIGANAVVIEDIPADCTAVGVPARIVRHRPDQDRNASVPVTT